MQGGEGATVRLCDRCDRCDGGIGATGWLSWFYFRFYFLLEQRERNRAEAWLGVAGGGSGQQRAESEKRDARSEMVESSSRVLENGLPKFFP